MNTNEHNENVLREFYEKESQQNSNEKTYDLGRVDLNRNSISSDDPEIQKINSKIGYISLDLSEFPSKGRFYRSDLRIQIRAARVGEIRDFSIIDETNIKDVDDKLNSILSNCCMVKYGEARGSFKDILEEDRIWVILKIKELTFVDGENKLMMPVSDRNCQFGSCGMPETYELKTTLLQFQQEDAKIAKYYDPEKKCYVIQTKSFGNIILAPPTIGVMRSVTDYIRSREENGKKWDQSTLQMLPYIQREWRGLTDKKIFEKLTHLEGWDAKKFSLIYRLIESIKVGVLPEMTIGCDKCGGEVTVPLSFPNGIKSLFIISDFDDELL